MQWPSRGVSIAAKRSYMRAKRVSGPTTLENRNRVHIYLFRRHYHCSQSHISNVTLPIKNPDSTETTRVLAQTQKCCILTHVWHKRVGVHMHPSKLDDCADSAKKKTAHLHASCRKVRVSYRHIHARRQLVASSAFDPSRNHLSVKVVDLVQPVKKLPVCAYWLISCQVHCWCIHSIASVAY